jgi:hypothetical protein
MLQVSVTESKKCSSDLSMKNTLNPQQEIKMKTILQTKKITNLYYYWH